MNVKDSFCRWFIAICFFRVLKLICWRAVPDIWLTFWLVLSTESCCCTFSLLAGPNSSKSPSSIWSPLVCSKLYWFGL